jgi:formylglycine-generating enzyme required for sulfatase activity
MFDKTMVRGLLAMALLASAVTMQAETVTMSMVTVGDPGNAADTVQHSGGDNPCGAVAYDYQIAQYDVTNNQYAAFLNAKATGSDPYGLWNSNMQSDAEGGINRTGSGPYSYSVKPGQGNQPVVDVSCPYGTFDQGGDVWQWNEADINGDGLTRGIRGGAFENDWVRLASTYDTDIGYSTDANQDIGFRVASVGVVPEPGSVTLLVAGGIAGLICLRRRR